MLLQSSRPLGLLGLLEALLDEGKLAREILHPSLDAVLMAIGQLRDFSFHVLNLPTTSYTSLCSITNRPTFGDSVALPAFDRRCCCSRSISPAHLAHGSKPAAAGLLLWAHAGTDRRTEGRTRYRFIDSALHTVQTVPISLPA